MEGRRDDLEIRDPQSAQRCQELFADREDRLLWMGPPLPAGIPLVVWSDAVLVPPLLGWLPP